METATAGEMSGSRWTDKTEREGEQGRERREREVEGGRKGEGKRNREEASESEGGLQLGSEGGLQLGRYGRYEGGREKGKLRKI